MGYTVEYTDEFGAWWDSLTEREQISVAAHVRRLEDRGLHLPFPYSSGIEGSRHAHMRELRLQNAGRPFFSDLLRLRSTPHGDPPHRR